MLDFSLSKEQEKDYTEWRNNHRCGMYAGAIGGRLSFEFTPTGLGMIVEVKCMCGETLNLTDWENW